MRENLVVRLGKALKMAELEEASCSQLMHKAEKQARKSRLEPYEDSEWLKRKASHSLAEDNLRRLRLTLEAVKRWPPLELVLQ